MSKIKNPIGRLFGGRPPLMTKTQAAEMSAAMGMTGRASLGTHRALQRLHDAFLRMERGERRPRVRTVATISPDTPKPPYHVGTSAPYENARRAGKTHPEVREFIGKDDPRSHQYRRTTGTPNRADLRAMGYRGPSGNSGHQPRNPVPRPVRRAEARRAA